MNSRWNRGYAINAYIGMMGNDVPKHERKEKREINLRPVLALLQRRDIEIDTDRTRLSSAVL